MRIGGSYGAPPRDVPSIGENVPMHAPVRATLGRAARPALCVHRDSRPGPRARRGARAPPPRPPRLRVGSLTLKPCADGPRGWWCGQLQRALDPRRPAGPRGSRSRCAGGPRPSGQADGPPLVAVEGGPGYPSIGSRVEYTGIYGPLLKRRNLLLVDNRGTGGSALIDCPAVQKFAGVTSTGRVPGARGALRAADRPRSSARARAASSRRPTRPTTSTPSWAR